MDLKELCTQLGTLLEQKREESNVPRLAVASLLFKGGNVAYAQKFIKRASTIKLDTLQTWLDTFTDNEYEVAIVLRPKNDPSRTVTDEITKRVLEELAENVIAKAQHRPSKTNRSVIDTAIEKIIEKEENNG